MAAQLLVTITIQISKQERTTHMTIDQEADVLDGLATALSYPPPLPPVLPPPLPKRARWGVRLSILAGLLLVGAGWYIYAGVQQADALAVRAIKTWDKTEALMASFHVTPPASCLKARSEVATLRVLQDKGLDGLAERLETMQRLAPLAKQCINDLEPR